MSTVYTSTRVTSFAKIKREHRLPRGSSVRVQRGNVVKATEALAVIDVARTHRIINLVEKLQVSSQRVEACLTKREGDPVEEGEVIATRRRFLRRRIRVLSPIDGRVIHIDNGQMLLEGQRERIEIGATVPGTVIAVEPEEYAIVETTGAVIQAAWAYGSLTMGTLRVMDTKPSLETETGRFNIDHRGMIVAIGSPLTAEFLEEAINIRVKGLIAPSMRASLVPKLADAGFPVVLTQGFGQFPMSERILSLLSTYNGREITLDTGLSGDWRERRPEIIIPVGSQQQVGAPEEQEAELKLAAGQKVRVLQPPHLGEIGTVSAIPEDQQHLESGWWTSGVMVDMPSGDTIFVPLANLEHLG